MTLMLSNYQRRRRKTERKNNSNLICKVNLYFTYFYHRRRSSVVGRRRLFTFLGIVIVAAGCVLPDKCQTMVWLWHWGAQAGLTLFNKISINFDAGCRLVVRAHSLNLKSNHRVWAHLLYFISMLFCYFCSHTHTRTQSFSVRACALSTWPKTHFRQIKMWHKIKKKVQQVQCRASARERQTAKKICVSLIVACALSIQNKMRQRFNNLSHQIFITFIKRFR